MRSLLKKIWSFRKGKWAIVILTTFAFLGIFADFIANDKPIYAKVNGKIVFPIFHDYGEALGICKPYEFVKFEGWEVVEYTTALHPLIRFSSSQISNNQNPYQGPLYRIITKKGSKIHWLGSDSIGRDVAAGIVVGARKSLIISLLAVLISFLIGLVLASLAGYFGDQNYKSNWLNLLAFILVFSFLLFQFVYDSISAFSFCLFLLIAIAAFIYINSISKTKSIYIPFDLLVMRLLEIFKSTPALFILLALLAILKRPGILHLIIILGLLRWTVITRVLRAEIIKLKSKEFVQAARVLGLSHFKILKDHIIPNALPPLMTILAFSFAGTILLEATISFLGIGLGPQEVTWGSLLGEARSNFNAWWLAIFPGLAIFLVVLAFNYMGETINQINLKQDD